MLPLERERLLDVGRESNENKERIRASPQAFVSHTKASTGPLKPLVPAPAALA
jgi:hypothetical protein